MSDPAETSVPSFNEVWKLVLAATKAPVEEEAFRELMESESAVEVVLKGHLYVERQLIRTLERAFGARGKYFDFERLRFTQKVELVAAMSLLPPTFLPALYELNATRNRMAHDLDDEATLARDRTVVALPAEERAVCQRETEPLERLAAAVITLVIACTVGNVLAATGWPWHMLERPRDKWWETL